MVSRHRRASKTPPVVHGFEYAGLSAVGGPSGGGHSFGVDIMKLTSHGDRVRAIIECGACGSDHQVSGDTFAEAELKLSEANGFTWDGAGHISLCPACDPNAKPVRQTAEVDEDDEEEIE